ncbi:hypothetical protein HNR21_005205 [Actinomadura cellulosilytica]|uniref:Uncharacterized protein n=1 Tax=Thermomonospora cellulosilytica TaxID=1411118 RepID=A0A7W3N2F4_9ACTN|nr:hypothetical protein [Thermomonospora cellulosilytica]
MSFQAWWAMPIIGARPVRSFLEPLMKVIDFGASRRD